MNPEITASGAPQTTLSDPASWVKLYGDYLYGYALMRLRNPELAEDAVQETLLAALKARYSFAGKSSEKTWLVGILKHKIIDQFRKQQREAAISFDEELGNGLSDPQTSFREEGEWIGHWKASAVPQNWPEDGLSALERKEFQSILQRCMDALPPRVMMAFSMREIDESESSEICKVLEISETNLYVMLHRARMQLRHCLELHWLAQSTL
jgi:RNA polymerase sigma-70 factor (ECF subfamily)